MYMDDIKLLSKNKKELETLVQTRRICSKFIGMEFGNEKYASLIMKSVKREAMEGIELPKSGKHQENTGEKENYKYMGILEANTIKQTEVKDKK